MTITQAQLDEARKNNPNAHIEVVDGEETIIVGASASLAASGELGPKGSGLAQAIEKAMSEAVLVAMGEGIVDPDLIRERKLAAREEVKKAFRQWLADRNKSA